VHEVRFIAAAIAGEAHSAQRAADELRILTSRDHLDGHAGVFVPARLGGRPLLLLAPTTRGPARDRLLTAAVAHVALRHHALRAYPYAATGPAYASPTEAREAAVFADAFVSALPHPHVATAAPRLLVVASGR